MRSRCGGSRDRLVESGGGSRADCLMPRGIAAPDSAPCWLQRPASAASAVDLTGGARRRVGTRQPQGQAQLPADARRRTPAPGASRRRAAGLPRRDAAAGPGHGLDHQARQDHQPARRRRQERASTSSPRARRRSSSPRDAAAASCWRRSPERRMPTAPAPSPPPCPARIDCRQRRRAPGRADRRGRTRAAAPECLSGPTASPARRTSRSARST